MDKMGRLSQGGGGSGWNFNLPEPMSMTNKPRDPIGSFNQGGMPRQITKNPLNMLGGIGNDRGGGYSNGCSSNYSGGNFGGDRGIGNNLMSDRPGIGKIGEGSKNQVNNGSGYTTDGYGMGAMSSRSNSGGQGSPGNGFSNNGGMYGDGMRGNGRDDNGMIGAGRDGLRPMLGSGNNRGDMARSNSDLMGRGDMMSRDMMGDMHDMNRGMMCGNRDMMRSQSEIIRPMQDMGGRDMMDSNRDNFSRDMMGDRVMSNRDGMMGGRDMMGGSRDRMGSREMMGGRDSMMHSNHDMMRGGGGHDNMMRGGGGHDNMMRGGGGHDNMMRSSGHDGMMNMMRNNHENMMRGGHDSMMSSGGRDMMRSISVSNGAGNYGGMGSGSGDNGFNRSMSYHGNSTSPPLNPDSGLKIGTWNDCGNGMRGNGGGMGSNGASSFPPVSNFEIGTFNMNDPGSRSFSGGGGGYIGSLSNGGGPTTQSNSGPIQPGMGIRETGIIEKLLHSYGFIQCCDRQARLFFHFSQFDGNIEHLKIGDPVEFEMTYDRRTGKPIASAVSKIAPEVVMSEERVIGTVTTEVKVLSDGSESQGRISYENRGECFFLPFNIVDVEGNVTLAAGEKVSFQMATVQRSGNLAAKTIRLENPAAPVKYQGVVNSLKDTFGYIERADVVKEIIFHINDLVDGRKEDNSHILLGDDVEFNIQTVNGKEVACNLTKLSAGTVVFEDVGLEYDKGQVLKPLDRTGKYQQTDPLPGRVKYRAKDRSEAEIPFGEKDQVGDFTLRHGDWIKFVVAIDRRDKHKRATKIELLDESFNVSDERREQGIIQSLKEGFGFLKCVDRCEKMFFHFSECLDVTHKLTTGDEVEFTVAPDPANLGRQLATRIKHLPSNTVKFDIVIAQNIIGLLTEEPSSVSWPRSPAKNNMPDSPGKNEGAGKIVYELNGLQLSIPLFANDCDLRLTPKINDKVQFNINQLKSTKETNAVNIRILERAIAVAPAAATGEKTDPSSPPREKKENQSRLGTPQRGYVAALKDGFGFIETLQHDKEIFFHFSNVEGKIDKLEVGQEVEYSIYSREKGGKVSAEGVKPLVKGAIPKVPCRGDIYNGKVMRPLRSVNPDQEDYCGLIVEQAEDGTVIGEYEFGIASLLNKKELLQEGDPVNFQVSKTENFALNVKSNKQKLRSHVEAVKGAFGFLAYEQDEGKKLFFHMSEVEGGEVLQVGDEVEFVVVTNQRTRKHSACCVRKLCTSRRPERLISKLKTMNIEEAARGGPKVIVVRQPKGPDGTKGFKPRGGREQTPLVVMDLMEQLTAQ